MFFLLPPLLFILLFLCLYGRDRSVGLRQSALGAGVLISVFIAASTELLSSVNGLTAASVRICWAALAVAVGCYIARFHVSLRLPDLKLIPEVWRVTGVDRVVLILFGAICLMVGATAILAPPNTYDSMTYHLPRIGQWIQAGNLDHFPTSVLRQIYQSPFAEYAIMHSMLLSGDDRFVNLVQFAAFIGCALVASLIGKEFGQHKSTQYLSMLLAVTLPMAILQGSSTQNDLVAAVFTLAFFYYFLVLTRTAEWQDAAFAGASLGIALLTKGTAYLFCLPIGVILGLYWLFRGLGIKKLVVMASMILAVAALLNAGHYSRNLALFGTPVSTGDDRVSNEALSGPILIANVVRNLAIHMGSNSEALTEVVQSLVTDALGDQIDNPASTWPGLPFTVFYSKHEDSAGNLLHLFLLLLALSYAFVYRGTREERYVMFAAASVIFGFVLFCGVIKWQPFASRLHTPLFMLGVPVIGLMLSRLSTRTKKLVSVLCFCGSLPFLLEGQPRNLSPDSRNLGVLIADRSAQVFANAPSTVGRFVNSAAYLRAKGANEIGLDLSAEIQPFGDWEYPLWLLIKDDLADKPIMRHVGVGNVSGRLETTDTMPEWVVSTAPRDVINNVEYKQVWDHGGIRILRRADRTNGSETTRLND